MTTAVNVPYPKYKLVNLGWLSEIPSHWQIKRLKYLGETIIGLTYTPDDVVSENDGGILVLRSSNIQNRKLAFEDSVYVSKAIPKNLVTKLGDILICVRNGSRALIGKNVKLDESAVGMTFGAFMSVFRSPLNDYLSKVFNSPLFEYQSGSFLTATINQLTTGTLNSFEIPLPPADEREKIVAFLDHETAKIDTLIEKQQQLIKLLKEKRQAVISHAVTKGLNPNAPMRDSGVEWLGDVPKHWDVKRIGTLFCESNTRASSEAELKYPVLSVSIHDGISDKELDEDELDRKITRSEDKSLYKIVYENDLAYNMMRAWQGGFGSSKLSGLVSPAYVVCRPKTSLDSSYFELVLRTPNAVTELKRYSRGITDFRLRLYWDEFKNIQIPVPPATELNDILKSIAATNATYDRLTEVAERQIKLLQERRTALISAAVTGKIDVRNWQAPSRTTNQQIAA
ncbi:MAG: restriction endonuclease subunit S [Bacillota bacterium]